jgi:hypothetical protein
MPQTFPENGIYIVFLSVTHNLIINEHICNATARATRLAVADERTKSMESVTERVDAR